MNISPRCLFTCIASYKKPAANKADAPWMSWFTLSDFQDFSVPFNTSTLMCQDVDLCVFHLGSVHASGGWIYKNSFSCSEQLLMLLSSCFFQLCFHFLKPGCFWSHAVFVQASCQLEPLLDFGEGNGNPLQYSCLENPVDRGGCWAAVHGVAQSQTRLMRLSSNSSRSARIQSLLSSECGQGGAFPAQGIF